MTAKSISIKNAKRKPGDCAQKATGLTRGDLPDVLAIGTERAERQAERLAEVSRGHSSLARGETKARTVSRGGIGINGEASRTWPIQAEGSRKDSYG